MGQMIWYYWSDERRVAVGPLAKEDLFALYHGKIVRGGTRVAQGGTQDWRCFAEAFPDLVGKKEAAKNTSAGAVAQGNDPLPGVRRSFTPGGGFRRVLSHLIATRRRRVWAAFAMLLVLLGGLKIHAKVERERQGREFRQKALADRLDRPVQQFGELNAVRRCPQCKGAGVVKRTSFPSPGTDWASNDPGRCRSCGGQGTYPSPSGREMECKDCNGRGFSPETACGRCNGRGTVSD